MFRTFSFFILISLTQLALAQKVYFDRSGKSTSENQAFYYREKLNSENEFKSYYLNGSVFFEGKIIDASSNDESKNVYQGLCKWYHKNAKLKSERKFNEQGQEEGKSVYYFESGKIWKELMFEKGFLIENRFKEYSEDGQQATIFEENFNNNTNDWDLYHSDKSYAAIANGKLELISFTNGGTSRFKSIMGEAGSFALEAEIDIKNLKNTDKSGIIYGFKDWQNYNFFYITQSSFYIGFVFEGISAIRAEGMFSPAIQAEKSNTLKIIANGEKNLFSINGELQFSTDRTRNYGSNVGIMVSGKSKITSDKLVYKQFKSENSFSSGSTSESDVKASGSGIVISKGGYILTNYHVVENANSILVELLIQDQQKVFKAKLIQKDSENDLAILKISDETFTSLNSINYSFKENGSVDVGSTVFTIGFPFALNGMGKEAKFTDGKVSAKTGYNGALNTFQTSIPVQPGNSGGGVFNEKGELVGVINAKIADADNVSYAVKLNYIKNLIEVLPETIELPSKIEIQALTLEEKIKQLLNYVVLIKIK
jgi:S1-C subfamily serine protease